MGSCRPEVFSFKSFHERWNPLPQSHHTCPAAAPLPPLKFCIISKSPLPKTTSPLRLSLIRSTSTHTAVQPPRGCDASGTLCHRTLDCPSHQTHLFKHSVFNLIIQLSALYFVPYRPASIQTGVSGAGAWAEEAQNPPLSSSSGWGGSKVP